MRLPGKQRRNLIINTGAEIANRDGSIMRATSRRIAEDIGMSKTGLLHHFKTHEALWCAIIASGKLEAPGALAEARKLGLLK